MEKKKLKTLEEFNSERYTHWNSLRVEDNEPRPNGIACPNCGEELYDSSPGASLMSNPPKKNVICLKCDYVGYRIA